MQNIYSTGKILGYGLTHWGRVTHICVSKLTIIGSDNGLSPHRRQAIIWTNAGILLIGPLGTNFSEISIEILTLSFKKLCLKVSSAKRRPFCLGLNVLTSSLIGWAHDHWNTIGDHAVPYGSNSDLQFSNLYSFFESYDFLNCRIQWWGITYVAVYLQ